MVRWSRFVLILISIVSICDIARMARAREELNLFVWSEYVPQEVVDGFTKETGIQISSETYASNEEMLSKLFAAKGKYDLIQPSEYVVELLAKRGRLEELDWGKIPNIKNIGTQYLRLGHDPEQKFTVPWMSGTIGIVVNTDKVKEPIKGLGDMFQARFKGRIVAVNDNRELVSCVMDTLGIPINDVNTANLEKVRPVLADWIKLVKVFDSDSPKTALINGDVDLGLVWSGEAALCYNANRKFQYVLPSEGAHMFIDSLCIPVAAPHKQAAMRFMNYILRPEVSKLISDKFPYTNPNLAARKLLSQEQLANPASYPAGNARLETFHDIGKASRDIDRLMTDLKSAG